MLKALMATAKPVLVFRSRHCRRATRGWHMHGSTFPERKRSLCQKMLWTWNFLLLEQIINRCSNSATSVSNHVWLCMATYFCTMLFVPKWQAHILGMCTKFHSQTGGQTECMNGILEDTLEHFVVLSKKIGKKFCMWWNLQCITPRTQAFKVLHSCSTTVKILTIQQ